MKRLLFAMLIVVVLAGALAAPAAASGNAQTVSYVVKPDDTLSSIARQFCTTWQQIYYANQAAIGPNPNVLRSGTLLVVPNQCGGQPPQPTPPAGCNLGPIPHAMGPLNGNIYTVVAGDTLFSIARRFCTTVNLLATTNGIPHPARIYVGQRLAVPVGTTPTPTPTPPAQQRYLSISSPLPNQVVSYPTFTATGTGAGLFEGNVVVKAYTSSGGFITQQAVILQGANVGTGGPGTWTATLNVSAVSPGTAGYVEASSPQSNVTPVRVNVVYGQAAPSASISITEPVPNAQLGSTFTVRGTASGLQQGAVDVRALSSDGTIELARGSITVPGGSGQWQLQLALLVPVAPGTLGQIVASWSQDARVFSSVNVRF
jgi:LysM repeat protein